MTYYAAIPTEKFIDSYRFGVQRVWTLLEHDMAQFSPEAMIRDEFVNKLREHIPVEEHNGGTAVRYNADLYILRKQDMDKLIEHARAEGRQENYEGDLLRDLADATAARDGATQKRLLHIMMRLHTLAHTSTDEVEGMDALKHIEHAVNALDHRFKAEYQSRTVKEDDHDDD